MGTQATAGDGTLTQLAIIKEERSGQPLRSFFGASVAPTLTSVGAARMMRAT